MSFFFIYSLQLLELSSKSWRILSPMAKFVSARIGQISSSNTAKGFENCESEAQRTGNKLVELMAKFYGAKLDVDEAKAREELDICGLRGIIRLSQNSTRFPGTVGSSPCRDIVPESLSEILSPDFESQAVGKSVGTTEE